jgi:Rrf2 family protein
MLTITKQSDYGILLISHIYKKNKLVNLSDLIKETKLPKRFLARIAAQLVKAGLLISHEGKGGGYQIGKKINKTSLYDYLKIFKDDFSLCDCGYTDYHCRYEDICHHKTFSKKLSMIIINQLKKTKLTDLL